MMTAEDQEQEQRDEGLLRTKTAHIKGPLKSTSPDHCSPDWNQQVFFDVPDLCASPRFQEKQRFLTDVLHEVMLLDGLSSSHPISQEVERATDIDRVFDWIAYKKVRGQRSREGHGAGRP